MVVSRSLRSGSIVVVKMRGTLVCGDATFGFHILRFGLIKGGGRKRGLLGRSQLAAGLDPSLGWTPTPPPSPTLTKGSEGVKRGGNADRGGGWSNSWPEGPGHGAGEGHQGVQKHPRNPERAHRRLPAVRRGEPTTLRAVGSVGGVASTELAGGT